MKEFGYRLSNETGYFGKPPGWFDRESKEPSASQAHAAAVDDFICPRDRKPVISRHGIPSSFCAAMAGEQLVSRLLPSEEIVLVYERQPRHRDRERKRSREPKATCVFLDLHLELLLPKRIKKHLGARY